MRNLFKRGRIVLGALLAAAVLSAGCGDSENFVFTGNTAVPVPPVPVPPVANNDAFNALGNATLNQGAAGVLANDQVNGATISAFDATGSQGGTINLNADGSFTYTPVFGFSGVETFTYTLTNADGTSTATVTLTSNGFGRFVDNTAPAGGNGSQASPFNNLTDGLGAALTGDTIFVYFGDGTNNNQAGAFTLPAGVNLIGQAEGLILTQTIEPAGNRPVLQGPITLMGDNTVAGIQLENSGGDGISADGVSNLTIDNNVINTPADIHLDLEDTGGTLAITDNTFGPANDDYVEIDQNSANATITITGNTFTDDGTTDPSNAVQLDIDGTSNCPVTFSNNTITSNSVTNAFDDAVEFDIDDTAQVTLTVDGNTVTTAVDVCFDINSDDDSSVTGSITGNTINGTDGGDAIQVDARSTVTTALTISGNVISNSGQDSIDIDSNGSTDGSFRILVENNNCSGAAFNDINVASDSSDATESAVFVRGNTFASTADDSIDLEAEDNDLCCDVTGNTVSENIFFELNGSGTLRVAQFDANNGGPLDNLNTLLPGAMVVEDMMGDVTPAAVNACGTP